MSVPYYGLLLAAAASLSLSPPWRRAYRRLRLRTGARGEGPRDRPASRATAAAGHDPDPQRTDETIFTVLGLAKRDAERNIGPQTGNTVSPVLWEAARDALGFAGFASEDPMTGLLVTNWYSPPGKPTERLRITVFILSRALRSDSLSVTLDRQVGSPTGQWADAPVAAATVTDLETEILLRARQIHAERYRSTYYE